METAKEAIPLQVGGGRRGEAVAKAGAVLSAVVASSCCWLPLVLLAFGVSGAGIAGTLDAYRPAFIALTVAFLTAAFYFTYRPRKAGSAAADCCAPAKDCCSSTPTIKSRFSMMTLNKVVLWGVTVVAIAFLFFPQYMRVFLRGGNVELVRTTRWSEPRPSLWRG